MTVELETLVRSARGEGPSPAFVAALRERVEREAARAALGDGALSSPLIVVDPPAAPPSRRRPKLAVLAVAAAALVAVMLRTGGPRDVEIRLTPSPVASIETAEALTDSSIELEAGDFRVDTVGTPFAFSTSGPMMVEINSDGYFVLAEPDTQGSDDRTLRFTRLAGFLDPLDPLDPLDRLDPLDTDVVVGPESMRPTDELDAWIEEAGTLLATVTRREHTIAGRETTVVDLAADETQCASSTDVCAVLGTNGSPAVLGLVPGSTYRIWIVDQGAENPLVVVAAVDRPTETAWLDDAESIVTTLAIGEIGPNPILPTGIGRSELPFLDGIRVETDGASWVVLDSPAHGSISVREWPAEVEFVARPSLGGEVLEGPNELVDALRAAGLQLDEVGTTAIDGAPAVVVDLEGTETFGPLLGGESHEATWEPPPTGRLWMIDHPDRGLLLVVASARENLGITRPLVVERAEELLATLSFVEVDD